MRNDSSVEIGLTYYYSNLVEVAKKKALWVYGKYMGLEFWFSPKEFEEKLFQGGDWLNKINWILRSPRERVQELKNFINEMQQEIQDISEKYYQEKRQYE